MSWSSYCDNLVASGCVDKAAVCGLDDGGVWSQTAGFNLTPAEVKTIVAGFRNLDTVRANGVTLGGTKYFCLSAEDNSIQGKKGNTGVSIAKSSKCMIIGTYNDGQQPGNCRKQVETIKDYLSASGF